MKASKIVWGLITLAGVVYATYFVLSFAKFSLTTDYQSLAIERIIRARVSLTDIGVHPGPEPSDRPNRTSGCSFLLMEELWRDCKSVRVGVAQAKLSREQADELRKRVLPILEKPCDSVTGFSEVAAAEIRNQLGCTVSPQTYVATVLYLHRGWLEKSFVAKGRIE